MTKESTISLLFIKEEIEYHELLIRNYIKSVAIDFNLLNKFNEAIKSRVTKEATVLKFSSKYDKIQIKNLALKNTVFILLPVRMRDENY